MAGISKSLYAVKVRPTEDGLAPLLQPGQCCKDRTHGVWHFCTPDDTLFAVGGSGAFTQVKDSLRGLTIEPGPPGYACTRKGKVVANYWTVRQGKWVKV